MIDGSYGAHVRKPIRRGSRWVPRETFAELLAVQATPEDVAEQALTVMSKRSRRVLLRAVDGRIVLLRPIELVRDYADVDELG